MYSIINRVPDAKLSVRAKKLALVLIASGILVGNGPLASAMGPQVKLQQVEARAPVAIAAAEEKPDSATKAKENEEKYAGGASLKTDSDLEDSLKRASAFVAEGNYRNASILWDRVLKKSGNSLITKDGETYVSLVREVEQTIRNLPPNGLEVYRISADGKAKALMPNSPAEADEDSLATLVRFYFMSSLGDDAAYELGCRALDRRDFVAASRMFSKVLEEHPDPSIDRNEVLLRQAIAAGNLGDRGIASKLVSTVEADGAGDSAPLLDNVKNHLAYIKDSKAIVEMSGEAIPMRLGGPERTGVMPDLPEDAVAGDLTQGYEFRFPITFTNTGNENDLGQVYKGGTGQKAKPDPAATALSQKWKQQKWFPAHQVLYANDRLVLKTTNDLVCLDATGESDLAIWHSLWLNHFTLDDASDNARNYGKQYNRSSRSVSLPIELPDEPRESLFFFDRIHNSMSIHNGMVFTIEGKSYSQLDDSPPKTRKAAVNTRFGQPINLTRSRTNYLTAYDLTTGKVRWTRSAYEKPAGASEEGGDSDTAGRVGFMGTPVPFGNLVLCPVTEGGAIYVYAMDTLDDGKTVWKTFLCDDPSDGVDLFSPIEITIAGQEAYAVSGGGVLFALNAATGNIQFARRYKRDGKKKSISTNYNRNQQKILVAEGWDDDVVVAWKNALVVMASDHDYLFAIDRRNGEFLWDAPRIPFDEEVAHAYCLGTYDDRLYMATNKAVLCYDLAGDGKLDWYAKLPGNSYGRGFITTKAVYIPVEDSIVKFDIATGKKQAQVGVNLGSEDKVGNLFSDGRQIWVAVLNRVVALRSLRDRLVELESRIQGGDIDAVRERLSIYSKLEDYDKALADAEKLFGLQEDKPAALTEFLTLVKNKSISENVPQATLSFVGPWLEKARSDDALADVFQANYRVLFDAAEKLAAVTETEKIAADTVLGWLGAIDADGFEASVISFLTKYSPSVARLKPMLAENNPEITLPLIPVAARMESRLELMNPLLDSSKEEIRLVVARELAQMGEKSSLPVALELLASDDATTRISAFLILRSVTGQNFDFDADADATNREAAMAKWRSWLDENLEALEVETPVVLRFGRLLIATSDKVMEFRPEESLKKISEKEGFRPEDVSTTVNGYKVICEYTRQRIVVLDFKGKEIAKVATKYYPRSARKLDNGNFLVAWRYTKQPVVEINADGKVVWAASGITGDARCAERLPNGNTLVTLSNRVVEVDVNSNIVLEIGSAQGVTSCHEARRLPNGNTLVVHGTTVAEFDKDKNRVMRIRGSFSPKSAVRLPDGRTVVAHATGLRVFDKNSKKIEELVNVNVNSVWEY